MLLGEARELLQPPERERERRAGGRNKKSKRPGAGDAAIAIAMHRLAGEPSMAGPDTQWARTGVLALTGRNAERPWAC